jgi:anti-sigma regulatory factor (Ser/Thr protein kinase)
MMVPIPASELPAQRVRLADGAAAAAEARGHVRAVIGAWRIPVDLDTAVLLADELVANAVTHTTGKAVTLGIRCGDSRLRVDVYDTSPTLPVLRAAEAGEAGGRGLMLVDALSTTWGYHKTPAGKVVYFTLAFQPGIAASAGQHPEQEINHAAASLLSGPLRPTARGPRP